MVRNYRDSVDKAIDGLRGNVAAGPNTHLSLDEDRGGTFRGFELDDFQFHDGTSTTTVRPKIPKRRERRR